MISGSYCMYNLYIFWGGLFYFPPLQIKKCVVDRVSITKKNLSQNEGKLLFYHCRHEFNMSIVSLHMLSFFL